MASEAPPGCSAQSGVHRTCSRSWGAPARASDPSPSPEPAPPAVVGHQEQGDGCLGDSLSAGIYPKGTKAHIHSKPAHGCLFIAALFIVTNT